MKDWDRVEEVRELTVEEAEAEAEAEAKNEAKDSFKKWVRLPWRKSTGGKNLEKLG